MAKSHLPPQKERLLTHDASQTFNRNESVNANKYLLVPIPPNLRPKWSHGMRHRIVACMKYNVETIDALPDGYHVHHIDKTRWNDSPSNLWLCTGGEHHRLHTLDDNAYEDWVLNHHSP